MEGQRWSEGEWFCYRGRIVVIEVACLMEGKWGRVMRGGQFNGGGNDHVTEVVTLMGGRMVMLQRWPV